MTDQPPVPNQPGPHQPDPTDPGVPAHPAPASGPVRSWRTGLYVGLIGGIVAGAAVVGLTWALSGSDGVDADAEAVCGIIERTPAYTEDASEEDMRRWGVTEVGPSLAAQDAKYQPLADALSEALERVRQFDLEGMEDTVARVNELCDDL